MEACLLAVAEHCNKPRVLKDESNYQLHAVFMKKYMLHENM